MRRSLSFSALALSVLFLGCGGEDGPGPVEQTGGPGTFTARLVSPNGVEGGVLVHLIGNGVSGVEAAVGDLFTEVAGDTVKVLLLRETPGELSFRFDVPDTLRRPAVRLLQVAAGDNEIRTGLSAYGVELTQ